jgi:hypothetical protein
LHEQKERNKKDQEAAEAALVLSVWHGVPPKLPNIEDMSDF